MKAAYGEAAPPWELTEALLMKQFNKFPEELEDIDVGKVLRRLAIVHVYETFKKVQEGTKLSQAENEMVGDLLTLDLEREKVKE